MIVKTDAYSSRARHHIFDAKTGPAVCGAYKHDSDTLIGIHRLDWLAIDRFVREWPESHCYCLRCLKIMRAREATQRAIGGAS